MFNILFDKEELRKCGLSIMQSDVRVRIMYDTKQYVICLLFRSLKDYKRSEKNTLLEALKCETQNLCKILKICVPFGVAYHHSGNIINIIDLQVSNIGILL